MTCRDTEYSERIDKERGDIVVVDVSVWTVFRAALGWRDRNITSSESRRTRASSIDIDTGGRTRKRRPAIILERMDSPSGPVYSVALLTSMCETPYDSLNANAKDLLMPVVGSEQQEIPPWVPTISINEWDKCPQYVVTFTVATSDIRELWSKIRVSEEDLQLLEDVGEQQIMALKKKLDRPGAAQAWFNDV